MQYNLAITVTYLFELLISYIFFSQQGAFKRKKWICWAIGIGLFLAGAAVDILFSNTVWLNGLFFIVINFLFGFLAFDIRWTKAIFSAAVLDVLSTSIEFITIVLMSLLTKTEVTAYSSRFSLLVLGGGISKTLYFVACILLSRIICREKTSAHFPKVFYFYPLTVVAVLLLFWGLCVQYNVAGFYLVAVSVLCLVLLLSAILLFLSYQYTIQKENMIFSLQNQMEKIETDKRYYDILEKQNKDLLIYAHDTKNHLAAIQELNTDPRIEKYLGQMSEQLRKYSKIGHSGNRMLDIICNKYASECSMHGIAFDFDTHLANLKYVDDYDLVAILNNILDNAIEAAKSSAEKKVELLTDHRNTYDIITVFNSCDTPPIAKGQELQTTKKEKKTHGLGMKSVSRTLEKYHGDFDWNYDAAKKQFFITIMLSQK